MKIGEKYFKTPFLIASSDLISTKEQAEEVVKYGENLIGSIIWKTTTLEPKEGYKQPIVCDFYNGFLVASGMKNLGIHKTILEIKDFKKKFPDQSVILSIASVNFDNPEKEFAEDPHGLRSEISIRIQCLYRYCKGQFFCHHDLTKIRRFHLLFQECALS